MKPLNFKRIVHDSRKIQKMVLKVAFICSLLVFIALEPGVLGQCTGGSPMNLAVYEGTEYMTMICNSPTRVSWILSLYNTYVVITNYNDIVAPAYTNLFDVNPIGLIIKSAEGNATLPNRPIPSAGLYTIQIYGSTLMFGAKFTVVRQSPTCNCTAINSTKIQLNCNLTYADSSYNAISAMMTWTTADGNFYKNYTPVRMFKSPYWTSTSSIIVDIDDPTIYQCTVTFTKPTPISYTYVATNAPTFSASCIPQFCGKTTTTTTLPTTTTTPPKTTTEASSITGPRDLSSTQSGGLSEGGKIGLGVGIGVGAMLVIGGILLAVICSRYTCKWFKRTETGNITENPVVGVKETNEMDAYENIQANAAHVETYETTDVSQA